MRLARLRHSPALRRLVTETRIEAARLVQPLFVEDGLTQPRPVSSMPGVQRLAVDDAVQAAMTAADRGVGGVLLFGIPKHKDAQGSSAWDPDGPVPHALQALRDSAPPIAVMADTCLCSYTDHGHCGPVPPGRPGPEPESTLPLLARTAVAQAEAGAQIVAPSAMIDGQVAAIRQALDDANHRDTAILSYSTKFASAYYGPFRDAADSRPAHGDRRTHQLPPSNRREAVREAVQDEAEGADLLMVKPAGPYLDVVHAVRQATRLPLAAYQVSGEYTQIEAAAREGWIDRDAAIEESIVGIRRAGADLIITYYATEMAGRTHR